MRIGLLHLESGISGDMFLGALVGAGVPIEVLVTAIRAVSGGALGLSEEKVTRAGLVGTRIRVLYDGMPVEEAGGPDDGAGSAAGPAPAPAVAFAGIERRILSASLPEPIREDSLSIFRRIAAAEAALHGTGPEEVHFHELGAWDALADIVGSVAGRHALGVDRLYHGPVNLGGGSVAVAHGRLPVPAPVTLKLLEGRPCRFESSGGELTTPTGAALVAGLAEPAPAGIRLSPAAAGYGAGRADPPGRANLARLVVGEGDAGAPGHRVAVVEAVLDDATPEEGGHLLETLLESGALDATLTPTLMKKSRPGFLVRILCAADRGAEFAGLLVRLSPTLGARWRVEDRLELPRRVDRVRLPDGEVRIKVATLAGGGERGHPEYEDVARLARARGAAYAEVRHEAEKAWRESRR